jgi:hypothetical protein
VLDGKLDGDGAYTKIGYRSTELSFAWADDAHEAWAKELKFDIYASYDANNIYIFVVSEANHYFNEMDDGDGGAWEYSCIQVSLADVDDSGGDRLEYGIWRKSNDGGLAAVVWAQHPDAKAEFTPEAGKNYAVVLDGGKLYYETVVPINTFLKYDKVAEDDQIRFNIVIGQADKDNKGHIHTQYSSGCTGNGKNSDYFAKITLGKPILVAKLDKAEGEKMNGVLIGSETGWGGNTKAGRDAAFDGDISTFFDPTNPNDPDDFVGMKMSEPYILTEIRIHPRPDFGDRFEGASIWGFNGDVLDLNTATLIWESDEGVEKGEETWQAIPASKFLVKDAAFTSYAYYNDAKHGDVGEVELYGRPLNPANVDANAGKGEDSADAGAAGAGGAGDAGGSAGSNAANKPGGNAPKTGDAGIIILAAVMFAGVVVFRRKIFVK